MSTSRWMDEEDVLAVYDGVLLGHKKKNEVMPSAARCLAPGSVAVSEGSQKRTNVM